MKIHRAALAAMLLLAGGTTAANASALPAANLTLPTATNVDVAANTVTLPVYKGTANGTTVWYILTDASTQAAAKARGVQFAPRLATAKAVQSARLVNGVPAFDGAVDFTPNRVYANSATGFPPADAKPGAVGDAKYSPFVRFAGDTAVYNAPYVASGNGPFDVTTHANTADRVIAIDTTSAKPTVTLLLANGFFNGKRVAYISTDASDPGAAAIERAIYAPRLAQAGASVLAPIDVVANGPGGTNLQGVGPLALSGALSKDATAADAASLGSPNNVLSVFPVAGPAGTAYTPLWQVNLGVWNTTPSVLTSTGAVTAAVDAKHLTGPDGKAFGATPLLVNCPTIGWIER